MSVGVVSRLVLVVTKHAMERRLEAAGAEVRVQKMIVAQYYPWLQDVIRREIEEGICLQGEARSLMLMNPDTQGQADAPVSHPTVNPMAMQGRLYLVAGRICYPVLNGSVTTAIALDDRRRAEIEQKLGHAATGELSPMIPHMIERFRSAPQIHGSSMDIEAAKAAEEHHVLRLPSWFRKPDAYWMIKVFDDVPARNVAVASGKDWIERMGVRPEEPVFLEIGPSFALLDVQTWMFKRTSSGKPKLLPDTPARPSSSGPCVAYDRAVSEWWCKLFPRDETPTSRAVRHHGRLLMAVRPATARSILQLIDSAGVSADPIEPALAPSGTEIALLWGLRSDGRAAVTVRITKPPV